MTLKQSLDTLAKHIAKKAADKDTSLQESTDALKALTQLFAVLNKGKKPEVETSDEDTFEDLANRIEAANGQTGIGKRAS